MTTITRPALNRLLAYAASAMVILASAPAFPCGAAFGPSVTVDPHQDIILVWKDNIETYVFQPTFCGTSTDFGLILPVPAPLSEKPSLTDQQAFTTAATVSQPAKRQVVHHSGGIGCASGGSELANSGPGAAAVVASGRVGFLDWVELAADTTAELTDWLTTNGYPYSSTAASVFAYYVQKAWHFVAFRISQDAAPGGETICRSLGPIALSFPTPAPVVPSRMASAGNAGTYGAFSWRIFGITRGDTELAFVDGPNGNRVLWYSGAIATADAPSFSGLAVSGDRLTRLMLSFYSGSQEPDVALTTAAAHDYRGTEDVYVYDDSACSVGRGGRSPLSFLLALTGLAMIGLLCWRRWR